MKIAAFLFLTTLNILILQGCSSLPAAPGDVPGEAPSGQPQGEPVPMPVARPEPATAPAPVPENQSAPPASVAAAPDGRFEPPADLNADILYNLMLAEIAGQRGQLKQAVQYYVSAAMLSRDARIAERATRVAVYARDDENALIVAKLWAELAPDNIEANQVAAAMLVRQGDAGGALQYLEKVVDVARGSGKSYQLIVSLLSRERDRDTALAVMQKLAERRAEDVEAHYAYAQLALLLNAPQRALQAVDRLLALDPDLTRALILRSNILVRMEKGEESLDMLRAALERQPGDTELRTYYARRLVDENRFAEAQEQFQLLLAADPANVEAIYALGLLNLQTGKLDVAAGHFRRLLEMGQRKAEAHYYLGQIAEQGKDWDSALEHYQAVRSGRYYLEAQIRIAVVYRNRDGIDEARRHLRSITPTSAEVELRLYLAEGELLREAGMYAEAVDMYTEALGNMPDNTELLYARALIAEKIDRLDITEGDLRSILEREPENAQALNALGYTLADRTDRLEEALQYIQRAYRLKPDDPAIIDSMGWIYYRLGNYDKALEYLNKAFEKMTDPEIAAHLGEVLWVTGDHERAREVWEAAVRVAPKHKLLLDVIRRFTQ